MSDETFGFGAGAATAGLLDTEIPPEIGGGDFEFDEPTGGGGNFPPRITPGPARFRVEITAYAEQDANGSVHVLRNGKVPKLTYTAHVQVGDLGPGRLLKDSGEAEIPVRFNDASGFKSEAMKAKHVSTDLERLYTATGLLAEFGPPKSLDSMVEMLRNAGSRYASGNIGWTAGAKTDDVNDKGKTIYEVFSTKPNTKRGEKPWPRAADGSLATSVTFANGETKMAREGVTALYAPKVAKAGA